MTDKNQQELVFKLSMYEQQIQQLQQQLQAVEQAINELKSLDLGLNDLEKSNGKEILSAIGKGIFVKAKLISEELIVDIGGKNFVKKSIPETKKIINNQTSKLKEVKKELENNLNKISAEINKTITSAQEKK